MAPTRTIHEFMEVTGSMLAYADSDSRLANDIRELRELAREGDFNPSDYYQRLSAIEARHFARGHQTPIETGSVTSSDDELQAAIRLSLGGGVETTPNQSNASDGMMDDTELNVEFSYELQLLLARAGKKKRVSVGSRLPSPESIVDNVNGPRDEFETLGAWIRARTPADHVVRQQLQDAEMRIAINPEQVKEEVETLRTMVLSIQQDADEEDQEASIKDRFHAAARALQAMANADSPEAGYAEQALSMDLPEALMLQSLPIMEAMIAGLRNGDGSNQNGGTDGATNSDDGPLEKKRRLQSPPRTEDRVSPLLTRLDAAIENLQRDAAEIFPGPSELIVAARHMRRVLPSLPSSSINGIEHTQSRLLYLARLVVDALEFASAPPSRRADFPSTHRGQRAQARQLRFFALLRDWQRSAGGFFSNRSVPPEETNVFVAVQAVFDRAVGEVVEGNGLWELYRAGHDGSVRGRRRRG